LGCHIGEKKQFLIFPNGDSITYETFLKLAARFANVIAGLGLNKGDRLLVQVEKSPEALAVYAACVQSGIIFLPLNNAYTPAEVGYFLDDSGAKLVLADSTYKLDEVTRSRDVRMETLDADGSGSLRDLSLRASEKFDNVPCCADDLAALLYTSGTTGRSKGAMLTQKNLLSNAETLVDEWRFDENDVLIHALPIFHTHGLFVATNIILLAKASMIFLPKFSVETVLSLMPKATSMMGVPTFYTRLLDDMRLDRMSVEHMRVFISGSAPLLSETHIRFERKTGHRILERYGMTETNMNTSNPYNGERRAGTVGFPLPGVEVKITDPETNKTTADGKVGQIEVRGPNVFAGYWNMPEKTAEELREDGFFITGDLGFIDEKGYLQIVGRNKDLIISGGFNIYPKEIELLLDEQVGVLESAVVGAPHPDFGESVVAILVGDDNAEIDLEIIERNLAKAIAKFKRPKKFIIIDSLPRNAMGKVQKNMLRENYKGIFLTEEKLNI